MVGEKEVKRGTILLALLFFIFLVTLAFVLADLTVNLETPTNTQVFSTTNNVIFNCSVVDDSGIDNVTLYHDINGTFMINQTRTWGDELQYQYEQQDILLLHFNNDSSIGETSSLIYDWSGSGNNASVVAARYNSTGKFNGAFDFKGYNNETITIQHSSALNLRQNGTVEFWIKISSGISSGYHHILSKGNDNPEYNAYEFLIYITGGSAYIDLDIGDGSSINTVSTQNSGTTLELDEWHHVAGTWGNGTLALYINGSLDDSRQQTRTPLDSQEILRIGYNPLFGKGFNGSIDELVIYDRILTQQEIRIHAGNKPNDTSQTWTINNITDGNHEWNCLAYDNESGSNWSSTNYTFSVNVDAPLFVDVENFPSSEDDLDPGVTVNVTANITELFNPKAILQYKQSGAGTWINVTMTNTSLELFNASFVVFPNGIWNYRVWCNDSNGHVNISTQTNLSVESDYTWTRSPDNFGTVSGLLDTTESIEVLIINNTGDYTLNFDLSNDAPYGMTYNVTEPFDLPAKNVSFVNISATFASSVREDPVLITIDATTPSADPSIAYANLTLASYVGGPYFDVKIANYTSSISQSQAMNLSAYVTNVGNETANETWLNWSLPSGWTNASGNLTIYVGNLTPSSTVYNNITASISSSASATISTITARASCVQGVNDSDSKSVDVTCSNIDGVCGTGCTSADDVDCPVEIITVESGGGGGASGGGAAEILPEAVYEMTIGKTKDFFLPINNIQGALMRNIRLDFETSYPIQYIFYEAPPQVLYNETKNVTITITAPKYLTPKKWEMDIIVTAEVLDSTDVIVAVKKSFSEERRVLLALYEISKDDAAQLINESTEAIHSLESLNLTVIKLRELLAQATDKFDSGDYGMVQQLCAQIIERVGKAINVHSSIIALEQEIIKAKDKGISTPETDRLLLLTISAMEREDYYTAEARIKEAELTFALETKGEFNLFYWVIFHPFEATIYFILISFAGISLFFVYKFMKINSKLGGLEKEETVLDGLLKTTQKEYIEEMIPDVEYRKRTSQYSSRLNSLTMDTLKLESEKEGLLKSKLYKLKLEKERLLSLMKQTQDEYVVKGMPETVYTKRMQNYSTRLGEIEGKIVLHERKVAILTKRLRNILKKLQLIKLLKLEKKIPDVEPKKFEELESEKEFGKLKKQEEIDKEMEESINKNKTQIKKENNIKPKTTTKTIKKRKEIPNPSTTPPSPTKNIDNKITNDKNTNNKKPKPEKK
jgi:hypothetical protein